MADLKNELRWSHTRQRNWDTCPRLYFLAHYAHWNGWRRDADARTRLCYILTKMVNLPMFAGDVVHRTVESALKNARAGHTRAIDEWVAKARALLNDGWKESKSGDWRKDPKRNTNLFEHYHALEVTEADIARTRERAVACLEGFFGSEAWTRARETPPPRWRDLEDLTSVDLGAFEMWVKVDLAIEDAGGTLWLHDWKTGRERDDHRDQLMAYALHAHINHSVAPENMRLVAAYLSEGKERTWDVTQADLDGARERILMNCQAMADACDDPVRNTVREENFPMVDDRRVCAGCFFQSVCYKEGDWPCRDSA